MEKYKIKLEEEKNLLEEELKVLGVLDTETGDWEAVPESDLKSQEVSDEGDMAERSEDYTERTSTLDTLESRLSDINRALSKIENGEFGKCEICGKDIEVQRLEVNPSSRTCETCMNKVS